MNYAEKFKLLTSMGVHPSVVLGGCQDRSFLPLMRVRDEEVTACINLNSKGERSPCMLNYPSTFDKRETRNFRSGQIVSAEGVMLVDLENPGNVTTILESTLYNMVSVTSPEPKLELIEPKVAGFSWGKAEEDFKVREGMSVGLINRPGGMAPVTAFSRFIFGSGEIFERRGFSFREILNRYRDTLRRATVKLDLWSYRLYAVNVTRPGLAWLSKISSQINHIMELDLPEPWNRDLLPLVSSFTPHPEASELLVLVIGDKSEVDSALSYGQRMGFPSFLMGRVVEKGEGVRKKKMFA